MSTSKKYFWLKLKDDFFNDPKIKKLRRIAGGDTYTVIYLKIMLLSIKNGGIIEFQQIEKTLSDELSLILDEDENNIQVTLNYLEKMGMIEAISDESYLMQNVPSLIGSESDSAERVRRLRAKANGNQIELHDTVLDDKALQCNSSVTKCNTEIEKEIELDIEKDNKGKGLIFLPSCISSDVWNEWVQHRKEIKKTLTPSTIKKQISQLEKWDKLGMDTSEIIYASITNGWAGLFEVRNGKKYTISSQDKKSPSEWVREAQRNNNVHDAEVVR